MKMMPIDNIKWVPDIYPRQKWNTETVERYADAMIAGDEFPPITIEKNTNILLDGKHRIEAYKRALELIKDLDLSIKKTFQNITVNEAIIPDGISIKYFAATLSARHGYRLSNSDLKNLALSEFNPEEHKEDPTWIMPDARTWGKGLGLSKSTVYEWVSHFINRARADRQTKAWRLSMLGWTQEEIAERLGSKRETIRDDLGENSELGKIAKSLGQQWNNKAVAEWANRMAIPLTDAMAGAMVGLSDMDRLKKLELKLQPYDVWNFNSCHDLMGDKHPGRIPGELVCHVLYFFSKQGDLILDPMVGSGTTLDACLLMGRKARGYEIDLSHGRVDIESHDLSNGWPEKTSKANLIFWDPPYFDKMDSEYVDKSISGFDSTTYLEWFSNNFKALYDQTISSIKFAFLMSDWDSENAKKHKEIDGIFLWDYAKAMEKAGWKIKKQIQCPLSTQQVHPDIVNKFRESKRLARLGRYLLICEK